MRILLLLIGLLSFTVNAEIKQTLGPWDVHYIAVNTGFLQPNTAQQYGIVRSKYSALVNISVLDKQTKKAQSVRLSGSAKNRLGTKKELAFRRVKDGPAIYYLATVNFRDRETLTFTIDIEGQSQSERLVFSQEMFVDQ